MPLAPDFHRGLPPRQDPELEAREHRNRFNGGTSGVKYRPSIPIAQKFIAQRRVPMAKAAFIAKLNDRNPRRPAGPLFYPGVTTKLGAGCQPSLTQARVLA
jgi:hypothetical protein